MNCTPFPCLFGYKFALKSKQITTIQKNTSEKEQTNTKQNQQQG